MARSQGAQSILEAAEGWRNRCLVEELSILGEERLWTLAHLQELDLRFIQNPDERNTDFLTKFEGQLATASPEVKKLAAEMLWVMYLLVSSDSIGGETKRYQIRTVWGWSGEELDEDHELLGGLLSQGVANPGTAYNTQRWRELAFFITTMEDWMSLSRDRRIQLLGDAWKFAEWLGDREGASARQFRHILLFLLFPDCFEPISSTSHKQRIVREFLSRWGKPLASIDLEDRLALDREVLRIREKLESEHPELDELDFFREPIQSLWRETPAAVRSDPREARESRPSKPEEDRAWLLKTFGDHALWCIGTGGGGRLWRDFIEDEIIAIPWGYLGDLTEYATRDDVQKAIADKEGREKPWMDSLAAWQFVQEMKPGDLVIAKQGNSRLLGWGRVEGDYTYEPERAEYPHLRRVKWEEQGAWDLPEGRRITPKTLTSFDAYPSWSRWALETMRHGDSDPPEDAVSREFSVTEALKGLFLDSDAFSSILDRLGRRKNVILQGPPGVGKTFIARRLAYALIRQKAPDQVQLVQFHQSYGYEDFIQGWRPDGQGGFELREGIFQSFCRRAAAGTGPYVFIIDEINRGNLSRIFGELMMLIESDKRGREHAIPLTYSGGAPFFVPENVHLLGLMNTADRSLAMVDYALRRRFSFIDLEPAFGSERFTQFLLEAGVPEDIVGRINQRMGRLNQAIREDGRNLGRGFEIGHSFFVPTAQDENLDETWYASVIDTEIAPLLREYWFDQPDRVDQHLDSLRG